MRFSVAKCCFWKAGKIETDFKKIKWHVKMHAKKCHSIRKKRTDIFPPLGVPLGTLALQNAAFRSQAKWRQTSKK